MHPLKNAPGILYFDTPAVLIKTDNLHGSANIAPMPSAFWLGWRGILDMGTASRTAENLLRTRQCVRNLLADSQAAAVTRLACTHYDGLGPRMHPSAQAGIAESLYRGPAIGRARGIGQA